MQKVKGSLKKCTQNVSGRGVALMNLVFVGDLHIADRPPVGRVDDYTFTALGKLEHVARVCEEYKADYCFSTGDIFHLKRPNRVSHALVQELILAFKRFPCPVYVVPGNHDMGPDELESLTRQPLGVLERSGAIHLLLRATRFSVPEQTGKPEDLLFPKGGVWVVPRPWSTNRDADPSYYSLTEEERQHIQNNPGPVIGLVHGSVVNEGNRRPFPFVDIATVPDLENYDLFVAGHLHENLGVHFMNVMDKQVAFANPGSLLRIARNQASYTRKVQVLSVEVTERELKTKLIDIPVAPAAEVFGAKEPEPNRLEPNDAIQRFLEQLGEGIRADQLSLDELLSSLGEIEESVKVLVKQYLEEAQT